MKRDCLVIVSLRSEAKPLIERWKLKPLQRNQIEERFQLFYNDGIYLAISKVGKLASAIATTALLTTLPRKQPTPIVCNVGIAGSSIKSLLPGTLAYIHKVTDTASRTRYYPDILLKHHLYEAPLETHDSPVTNPPKHETLVDMEGSGFMQAALHFVAPSALVVLKVVSDMCDGTRILPADATRHIEANVDTIHRIIDTMREQLPEPLHISESEATLIDTLIAHGQLSRAQQIELSRCIRALKAQQRPFIAILERFLQTPIESKQSRNSSYRQLLNSLHEESIQ